MMLSAGTRVGPYEIVAEIGAGGMGVVYRARDAKLNRDVALKILPEAFALDADRVARFKREAQVLAALNHPNIAAIYGFEEADGLQALVLELVEGPTLADRIRLGALPLDEALPIARQIAEALESAHEQGIVHRDLKPANVKVREDGTVKVLDFVLAKAMDPPAASAVLSQAPTITTPAMTLAGVILGTAAYMSPEQAKGKPTDKRADIWAFGCVLYEMLTGRRAFEGEDVTETLAAVVKLEPDWSALPAALSPSVEVFLRRSLRKNPKERVSDIHDVRLALEGAFDTAVRAQPAPVAVGRWTRWRQAVLGAAAGLMVGGLAVGLVFLAPVGPVVRPATTFALSLPSGLLRLAGNPPLIAISPDGRTFVYAGPDRLYRRDMGDVEIRSIPGTEGSPRTPFFSPDGRWLGFFNDGNLRKVSLQGGPPIVISSAVIIGASWGTDGRILYGLQTDGLWRVSEDGGEPERVTTLAEGEVSHRRPHLLPGGRAALFTIWSGSLDTARVAVVTLDTGERRTLVGGTVPYYVSSGHIVFAREASLWAAPFDLDRLELTGPATPVLEGLNVPEDTGAAQLALAGDGTLVYLPDTGNRAVDRQLVWLDRQGRANPIGAPPRTYTYPRISPDGSQVALDIQGENRDVWIWNVARDTFTRLTSDGGLDRYPLWSPDGRRIVFSSQEMGVASIFWKAADGTGSDARLTEAEVGQLPETISPDGRHVVFRQQNDLHLLTLGGQRAVRPLLAAPFIERNAEVSPDGRWLAYESNESGQFEIYVRPFPEVERGRWQVSNAGGTRAGWARSGRELFFWSLDGQMMAVPVQTAGTFSAGRPEALFEGSQYALFDYPARPGRNYDVTADGQRFLAIEVLGAQSGGRAEALVIQNWVDQLRRLAPAD
ncbi:MAG: serine/threonine-protein kinase [Acidobacteria bacterium]|nr:serine/threonine-protein kinase [Acidobacteriota bacterium]